MFSYHFYFNLYINLLFSFALICSVFNFEGPKFFGIFMLNGLSNVYISNISEITPLELIALIFLYILSEFIIDLVFASIVSSSLYVLILSIYSRYLNPSSVPVRYSILGSVFGYKNVDEKVSRKESKFWDYFEMFYLFISFILLFVIPYFFPNYLPKWFSWGCLNIVAKVIRNIIVTGGYLFASLAVNGVVNNLILPQVSDNLFPDDSLCSDLLSFVHRHPIFSFLAFSLVLVSGSYLFYSLFNWNSIKSFFSSGDKDPDISGDSSSDIRTQDSTSSGIILPVNPIKCPSPPQDLPGCSSSIDVPQIPRALLAGRVSLADKFKPQGGIITRADYFLHKDLERLKAFNASLDIPEKKKYVDIEYKIRPRELEEAIKIAENWEAWYNKPDAPTQVRRRLSRISTDRTQNLDSGVNLVSLVASEAVKVLTSGQIF